MHDTLRRVLLKTGMEHGRADLCARLFAEASRDGVPSHGLNRFPRFLRMIENGAVDVNAAPVKTVSAGAIERWDGRQGPGNLNAHASMARAIELARAHGIGCVALANTNHWMRGGAYGWQAAEAGVIGICWTNTLANVPPWGSSEPRIGNNPLVIAVPRGGGHIVLDMAMSQFSVGALSSYAARGEALPVDGGYDANGNLTRDPAAIEATRRLLPIGFWKGSGLALMLDLLAAMLSGGRATHEIATDPEGETALSQVFIAIDPSSLSARAETDRVIDAAIAHLHAGDEEVRHPAQRTLETRARSLRDGVAVDPAIWTEVKARGAT
jgi:3-dehydro-L-gulonate 2-dehydrogenase